MKVTPLDIQQQRFHVAFRGYERTEVDAFLETVREEMEALVREVTELREFHETFNERMREYREREETLKNTMITTHKLAEDIKESSKKEAQLIVKDAEIKYQQTLERAREERMRLESEISDLRRQKHHFLQDMRKMMQMHLEMVNFEEAGGEGKGEKPAEQA
ncbi:MAG: DivIVA domain-containing protein [Nitrospirota bacterium]